MTTSVHHNLIKICIIAIFVAYSWRQIREKLALWGDPGGAS
jgi:hypothetical protein